MNLEKFKEMVDIDIAIDDSDLTAESMRSPMIHSKYLKILVETNMELERLKVDLAKVYKNRWSYYMGNGTNEEYRKNPQPIKVLKTDVKMYLEADDVMSAMKLKVKAQEGLVKFVDSVIANVHFNRTKTIRDIIDWRKFEAGN
jgi:hypothetical protein